MGESEKKTIKKIERSAEQKRKDYEKQMRTAQGKWESDRYWKPGQELTQRDQELLQIVRDIYEKQGYTPPRKDIPEHLRGELKTRFRTWGNVKKAAGLPPLGDPEQMRRYQQELQRRRNEGRKGS